MKIKGPAPDIPRYSVVIPAYNAEATIAKLLDSLMHQRFDGFEVLVVDDGSTDRTSEIAKSYPFRLIENRCNKGPAFCRNTGVRNAKGGIVVFTDSDCRVAHDWLQKIDNQFMQGNADAIMGKLVLLPSNYVGESISALGFPAGGTIGFDKIWRVNAKGYTDSLSTCNCAITKKAFWQVGGFDETFPYAGGEDSFLAYNLKQAGHRIKYCPEVLVYHVARNSFLSFVSWQFKRGISSYIFSQKITARQRYLSLRIWSTRNILRQNINDAKFPLIVMLLATGYVAQICGYLSAHSDRSNICTF